ncbi:MAG: cytochrome c biogenesis protein CcsA [Muribaculaceae bacterium]|nr:cytochrome c biogenesis protein CcsA [Muribaculaceae bacterium]
MTILRNRPFTLIIHIALAIIVAGAFVTHFCGIQGTLVIDQGQTACRFEKTSGPGDGTFPWQVTLDSVTTTFYSGTTTPMDFASSLKIDNRPVRVSMNNVAQVNGWRFYQTATAPGTSTLSVSHDPWGIGITYTGYILLAAGMAGFFFERHSLWRALLRQSRRTAVVVAAAICAASATPNNLSNDLEAPPALQRPLAANFGRMYVYWNGRVCPLQTMARDVTIGLYGTDTYRGLTAEQTLTGWLFYFDQWLADYRATHPGEPAPDDRRELARRSIITQMGTGQAWRIFPYRTAAGHMEWLSLAGRRPSQMSHDQWLFMLKAMPAIKHELLAGHNIAANDSLSRLIDRQRYYAGAECLPSAGQMSVERLYNSYGHIWPLVAIMALGALLGMAATIRNRRPNWLPATLTAIAAAGALNSALLLAARGYVAGHMPLSNGSETMLFMALLAAAGAVASRGTTVKSALLLVGAMAGAVAMMGGRSPQITPLMPVLASPLLSVHAMLVMGSYVLFMLIALLSAMALCRKSLRAQTRRLNLLMLVVAEFLLTAGIFVGAVWANQSWGRYWGWDPKETCALVTMLVYAVPLHWPRIKLFADQRRHPAALHWYLLLAVLCVAFTYFGANYLMPGLHSYA